MLNNNHKHKWADNDVYFFNVIKGVFYYEY